MSRLAVLQRRANAGRPGADHQHVHRLETLVVAVRIRSARTPSQTGRGANQPFIPMPVRCDERFVVKARRHQNFEIAEDAEQIEASAGPRIDRPGLQAIVELDRSEEHTSELQSLMRISYAV